MVNPRDEIAFKRVVNKPPRGLGQVSIDKIVEQAGRADAAARGNLLEACRSVLPELSKKPVRGLKPSCPCWKQAGPSSSRKSP